MFALIEAQSSTRPIIVAWNSTENISPQCISEELQNQPSILDVLAAPTVFLQQALVYTNSLDAAALKMAIQCAVNRFPIFGARLTEKGTAASLNIEQLWTDSNPHAAAASSMAMRSAPIQQHQEQHHQQEQQQLVLPELPDALFGHLPGALLPSYADCEDLALVHVALVQLAGGGSVVGLRVSHLLGDWTSARLLLRSIATAYSRITQQPRHSNPEAALSLQSKRDSISNSSNCDAKAVQQLPGLLPAGPLLDQLVAAVQQELPADFQPVRLKVQEQSDEALFAKLVELNTSSNSTGQNLQAPLRLTYHVLPDRIKQLKSEAQSSAAVDTSNNSRAFTTHNVVLAQLVKAFCSMPGRSGVAHDIAVSVDMRSKVPEECLQALGQMLQHEHQAQSAQPTGQQLLAGAVGNFFASAIVEDCLPAQMSFADVAQQLNGAIIRSCKLWLPDLAWASGILRPPAQQPVIQHDDNDNQPGASEGTGTQNRLTGMHLTGNMERKVTWRRLHAMGPIKLLTQQMKLGLFAALTTTQWALDYQTDAALAGQIPVLAVPSFSQPQPYPLVLMQQAPEAMGGGMIVHVWLDQQEAGALQQALAAQGGV